MTARSVAGMGRQLLVAATVVGALVSAPSVARAQVPADTAAVLYQIAQRLAADGQSGLAQDLLRLITTRYPGSPVAQLAAQSLGLLEHDERAGSGRVQFVVWSTLYGAWLGLAVPAALGADEPEPFGGGLLAAAPIAFFGSRAFANQHTMSTAQAQAVVFGSQWGTWQGFAWRAVLDLGDERYCQEWGCYEVESERGPFAGMVLGGLTGYGLALALGQRSDWSPGDVSLVNHTAYWGTWYGLAAALLADDGTADDDEILSWLLAGGNAGLLTALLVTPKWDGSSGQVRLISIAGVAGGVAGLGLDLLMNVEDEDTAVLIPTLTATTAMAIALTTLGRSDAAERPEAAADLALVNVNRGWRVGTPVPQPAMIALPAPDGGMTRRAAVRIPIVAARF